MKKLLSTIPLVFIVLIANAQIEKHSMFISGAISGSSNSNNYNISPDNSAKQENKMLFNFLAKVRKLCTRDSNQVFLSLLFF